MSLFINNADFFLSVGTVCVLFLVTFFGIPYAQKRGWLSQDNINAAQKAIEVANLALNSMSIGSAAGKTALILKATEAAVGYVEQTMKLEDNELKKISAQDAAIKFLESEGVVVSEELRKLIEVGLQSAVNKLPKTNP